MQRYRDSERDHVGVGGPSLGVHELHGHVGALVRLRQPGLGAGDLDLLGESRYLRMVYKLGVETVSIEVD
ncbi:hypothetical protein D3C83_252520 [compost metagenome]